jgi:hypothetical protein
MRHLITAFIASALIGMTLLASMPVSALDLERKGEAIHFVTYFVEQSDGSWSESIVKIPESGRFWADDGGWIGGRAYVFDFQWHNATLYWASNGTVAGHIRVKLTVTLVMGERVVD